MKLQNYEMCVYEMFFRGNCAAGCRAGNLENIPLTLTPSQSQIIKYISSTAMENAMMKSPLKCRKMKFLLNMLRLTK
jgi:hypothetical protein